MEDGWAYLFVNGRDVVLSDVVGFVKVTTLPVIEELTLGFAVLKPVEAHVNGFGLLLLEGLVADAFGGRVVSLDSCWGLGMSKFLEHDAEVAVLLAIEVKGCKLGFRC